MRILIMTHNLKEQGNYFRAAKIAQHLASKGHDVTHMTSSDRWYKTRKYTTGKVRMIETPSYSLGISIDRGWSPLGLAYRLWFIIANKFDIVYGFSHNIVDFLPAYVSKIFRKSFYITDWCDWYGKGGIFTLGKQARDRNPDLSAFRKFLIGTYDKAEEFLEEFVPKRADLVTVICRALHERALGIGIREENLLRLISGADTDSIVPIDKLKAREAIALGDIVGNPVSRDDFTLLGYVANYHFDEILLLEAFSKVCEELPNVKLLVVGPELGVKKNDLRKWGLSIVDISHNQHLTKEGNVLYFGRRPFKEIKTFLGACDILLLPMTNVLCNRGRWPHKTGDYLASGRPIVVNKVGDIPDIFKGENAGYIADANADDFAEKIIEMVRARDKWEQFGRNARRIAETTLDWERIGEELYSKLKQMNIVD